MPKRLPSEQMHGNRPEPWPRTALLGAATLALFVWVRALGDGGTAGSPSDAPPGNPGLPMALVQSNGTIVCLQAFGSLKRAASTDSQPVRFDFGLPPQPPVRRWLEHEAVPICRTSWDQNHIRYTQTVLVTRLSRGDLLPDGALAADAVLVVNLFGENSATEYTDASAAFAVQAGDKALVVEWRDGFVHLAGMEHSPPLAWVDIPSGGIAGTRGARLRFQGNMPPATTGSMTIMLPLATLDHEETRQRLQDLNYDEEFQRVKRFWIERAKAGWTNGFPVVFAGPGE